jgi:vacuolar-type H+-ATPase catalytic subunit A/Vma1
MTFSDWITALGVVVTLCSMLYTIWQAYLARRHKEEAQRVLQIVNLSAVAERLKNVQEYVREIAPEKLTQRGFQVGERIDKIRKEFDVCLGTLPAKGACQKAREKIGDAQTSLGKYEKSIAEKVDSELWYALRVELQDAISNLSDQSLNPEF